MSRAWVSSLLRARQVQEDVARQRLAQARRHAQEAHAQVHAETERLEAMNGDAEPTSVLAFVAAASARHSAAATWFAAKHARAVAEDQVAVRAGAVTAAAQDRRGVEKLAERAAAEAHQAAATAMQKELDEIGGRRTPDRDAG